MTAIPKGMLSMSCKLIDLSRSAKGGVREYFFVMVFVWSAENFRLDRGQFRNLYHTKFIYIKFIYVTIVNLNDMKLTTKTRYGARLLIDLAQHQGKGVATMREISKRQNISVKYLEQIIRPLKKAKLVKSTRGPKGGHMLSKKPENITLGDVTRLFEGQPDLVDCVNDPEKCSKSDDCLVRLGWQKAARALYRELDSITIADLLDHKIM
jgi:Rrf2 family iron-sulfur cluster assembly transcriptional regulator